MNNEEMRFACLQQAIVVVAQGQGHDAVSLAGQYYDFVTNRATAKPPQKTSQPAKSRKK